jgi:hypothetical protein
MSRSSIPVTIAGGILTPAWYDIHGLEATSKQDILGAQKATILGKLSFVHHLFF